jgi:hypothetical protein
MRRRDLLRGVLAQPAAATGLLSQLLGLKYVQAELYRQGNARNLLSGAEAGYLAQIGEHKQAHVAALAQALAAPPLNAAPPPPPAVSFDAALASRDTYLAAAYAVENALVRFYVGLPALAVTESIGAQFQLPGLASSDARALAVLGALTGQPIVGGILSDPAARPLSAEELVAAFQPFLADAADSAGTAGVTE